MTPFTAKLVRDCNTEIGVFGKLTLGNLEWFTVECPDLGNAMGVSCIPPGEYALVRDVFHNAANPYEVWRLVDVPRRTQIKVHVANVASELQGCIALGVRRGYIKGAWAVGASTTAFSQWMKATSVHESGWLTIAQKQWTTEVR